MAVLPMYMGVIPKTSSTNGLEQCAPHVYGGDPNPRPFQAQYMLCSPCIWG